MAYLSRLDSLKDTPNVKPNDGLNNLFVELNGTVTWTPLDDIFSEALTQLQLVQDELQYTDEEGVVAVVNLQDYISGATTGKVVSVTAPDNQTLTLTRDDGFVLDLDMTNTVKNLETITDLSYNVETTSLTYTAEDGSQTVVNLQALTSDVSVSGGTYDSSAMTLTLVDNNPESPDIVIDFSTLQGSVVNNNNGTYTYNNGNGSTTIIDTSASSNPFDGTVIGMTGDTNVQVAVQNVYDMANSKMDNWVMNSQDNSGVINVDKDLNDVNVRGEGVLAVDCLLGTDMVVKFRDTIGDGVLTASNGVVTTVAQNTLNRQIFFTNIDYTISPIKDFTVVADSSANTVTLTLPDAATVNGQIFNIKAQNNANGVFVNTAGGTIDGFNNFQYISADDSITVQAGNGNWFIL